MWLAEANSGDLQKIIVDIKLPDTFIKVLKLLQTSKKDIISEFSIGKNVISKQNRIESNICCKDLFNLIHLTFKKISRDKK